MLSVPEIALAASSKPSSSSQASGTQTWSDVEVQLLVKATTLFPIGTASRWDVIAAYINEHSGSEKQKTGKQVINKVKNLRKLGKVVCVWMCFNSELIVY